MTIVQSLSCSFLQRFIADPSPDLHADLAIDSSPPTPEKWLLKFGIRCRYLEAL